MSKYDKLNKIRDEMEDVVDAVKDVFAESEVADDAVESEVADDAVEAEPEPTPEPIKKPKAQAPDTLKAEVRCCFIETATIKANKGDIIEIPSDPDKHSPCIKEAIRTKNLIIDLAPVISEDAE